MKSTKLQLVDYLRKNDLLRAALLVGKIEDADFVSDPYLEKIMSAASLVWNRSSNHLQDSIIKAENINFVLFEKLGVQGRSERYKRVIDNPSQFYLHHLLNKKQGGPMIHAVLYLILAQQVGIDCECLAFPSHFILKVTDVASQFYIDPFDRGKFLTQAEFQRKFQAALQRNKLLTANLYENASPYQLIARMMQQLKHIYLLKNESLKALRAVELLTTLYPQSPELTRDRGILYCEMEYFSQAMKDLRFYLKQRPNADDIKEIKKLTSMLRGYQETMN